jgi:glyoxylase-like metal-dependent hydrolase (beta-lactamase superfamily II)
MTWYTTARISEDTFQVSEPFGPIEPLANLTTVNMYLVIGRERAAVIDSGMGIGDLQAEVRRVTSLPCTVLNTHYHWDHVGGNSLFEESAIHESEAKLLREEQDIGMFRQAIELAASRAVFPPSFDPSRHRIIPKPATHILHDNDLIDLGGRVLRTLHIPGHAPGHVAYLDEASKMLFTGDTACLGSMFACFEGSDPMAFLQSVERLAALQGVEVICPGHNDVIRDRNWLSELARCVEAAMAGRVPGHLHDDLIVGKEFRFGPLSIWLPQ